MADETILRSHGLRTNVGKLIRVDTLDGREHLVAPVVLITEGVHNNVYYSADELAKHTDAWNGRPLVAPSHPTVNGRPVTANSKKVLEKMQVGTVLNVHWNAGTKKLLGEAWFDKEKTQTKCPKVLAELEKEAPQVEVSTGLYTDDTFKANTFGTKQYACEAKNHRPDHLAVLLNAKGACSWEDGAGLPRINSAADDDDLDELHVNAYEGGHIADEDDDGMCPDCGGELVDGVCPECDGEEDDMRANAESEGEGRWVTMNGTPVFIKEGQDPKEVLRGANAEKANKPIESDTTASAIGKVMAGLKPTGDGKPFAFPNKRLLAGTRGSGDARLLGEAYRRAWLAGDGATGAKLEELYRSRAIKQNGVLQALHTVASHLGLSFNKKDSGVSLREKEQRVSKALQDRYRPKPLEGVWGGNQPVSCGGPSPWVRDLFDGYVVYELFGKTYKLDVTWNDGMPELGDEPVEVVMNTEWLPKNNSADQWIETDNTWDAPGWEAAPRANWDEDQHPRGEDGKFTDGGGKQTSDKPTDSFQRKDGTIIRAKPGEDYNAFLERAQTPLEDRVGDLYVFKGSGGMLRPVKLHIAKVVTRLEGEKGPLARLYKKDAEDVRAVLSSLKEGDITSARVIFNKMDTAARDHFFDDVKDKQLRKALASTFDVTLSR